MHSGFNALGLKMLFHGQFNMTTVIVVVQIAEDCPATISSNNTTKVQ